MVKRIAVGFLLSGLALLIGCSTEPKPGTKEWFKSKTTAALDSLATNPGGPVADSIAGWPSETVVPVLIDAMQSNPAFSNSKSRLAAFSILARKKVYATAEGKAFFFAALADSPFVAHVSARTLVELPQEQRTEFEAGLIEQLRNPQVIDDVKAAIVSGLKSSPSAADALLPVCREFLSDNARNERLRTLSVQAMLEIGGAAALLPLPQGLDSVGQSAAIFALDEFAGKTKGTFNTSLEQRNELRSWVLGMMEADTYRVRNAALRAVPAVFADDWFPTVNGVARLNPTVKSAIKRMIAAETDSAWRERLQKELVLLEQRESGQPQLQSQ